MSDPELEIIRLNDELASERERLDGWIKQAAEMEAQRDKLRESILKIKKCLTYEQLTEHRGLRDALVIIEDALKGNEMTYTKQLQACSSRLYDILGYPSDSVERGIVSLGEENRKLNDELAAEKERYRELHTEMANLRTELEKVKKDHVYALQMIIDCLP